MRSPLRLATKGIGCERFLIPCLEPTVMTKSLSRTAGFMALLMLAGCMAAPAQREARGGMDPRRACMAQCNRDNNVCMDQQSAQGGNSSYGMGATCRIELESCLARC